MRVGVWGTSNLRGEGAEMYLNVSQLLKETSGSSRTYEVDESLTLIDNGGVSHVVGTVRLLRTDKGIWVSAVLDSEVVCTCSRCLNDFEQPVHTAIEEETFPKVDIATGTRLNPTDGDENFCIDSDHILDMREAVRQYFELVVPMKPMCREDCAGICSTCGANLNATRCACDNTPIDRRWSALLDLAVASDKDR